MLQQILIYIFTSALLLTAAYFIFNRLVAQTYLKLGRLSCKVAFLQFLILIAFFCLPYTYLPPQWAWDWLPNGTWNRWVALVLVALGTITAFGTMIWFGLGRAFGITVEGVVRTGPYRYSRNPQMVGGWLMVLGVVCYAPSAIFYSIGWVAIWAVNGHWMVSNEEIHLRRTFGKEYESYCQETPRYLFG